VQKKRRLLRKCLTLLPSLRDLPLSRHHVRITYQISQEGRQIHHLRHIAPLQPEFELPLVRSAEIRNRGHANLVAGPLESCSDFFLLRIIAFCR
jgi:hypothetical protein